MEHQVRDDTVPVLPVWHRPYRSMSGFARMLLVFAFASVALDASLQLLGLQGRRVALIESLSALVAVPLVVVGVVFFVGLARNRPGLDVTDADWPTAWAALGWLIPVVWWVLPYFVVKELWRTSDPDRLGRGAWQEAPVPAWFHVWWLLWAGAGILSWSFIVWGTVHGAGLEAGVPDDPVARTIGTLSTVLGIAALFPFARLVREITARQDERRRRLTVDTAAAPGER